MSVSAEQWAALAQRAATLGITRTELIRRAIDRTVNDDVDIIRELLEAQRQLAAIKAALGITEADRAAA